MNEKCLHCSLLNEGSACPGQRNPRICTRADPSSELHTPGILEKIANFGKAVVQHVVAGAPKVTEEQLRDRLAICQDCEYHEPDRDRCRRCGCGLSLKASWADQACPLDPPKWEAIESERNETPR